MLQQAGLLGVQPRRAQVQQQQRQACPARAAGARRPALLHNERTASASRLVPRTASVQAPTSAASPGQPQPQQQEASAPAQDAQPGFSWTKAWWPVSPVQYLQTDRPQAVTLLGHTYVVWYDKNASTWRLQEDRCPHRLAPLSEGRIEADGTLMCSYHGWQFNGEGACTRIPQIGDPAKMAAAVASPRACVTSYPTTLVEGMLFAWLESGPEAEAEAAAHVPFVMPEQAGSGAPWAMSELPVDYTFWLEQGMDPTHANYLHHTCGFPMSDALPMPGDVVPPTEVTVLDGYTWNHGHYTNKHEGMQAVRQFVPPNTLRVVYDRGFVRGFSTMGTPVRPGVSRVFARFSFGGFDGQEEGGGTEGAAEADGKPKKQKKQKKKSLMAEVFSRLPHWAFIRNTLADQDTVVNVKQEAYMRALGLTPRDYAAFARADQGVLAAHKWFDAAAYEAMWAQRLGGDGRSNGNGSNGASNGAANGAAPSSSVTSGGGVGSGARYAYSGYTAPPEQLIFSWYDRHTKHCPECMRGMALIGGAANAAAVVGVLAAVLAASLAVAAKTLVSPGVALAAAAAAACGLLRAKLLEFRHTQFISSRYKWQKDGGLSLVKGNPVKVDLQLGDRDGALAAPA